MHKIYTTLSLILIGFTAFSQTRNSALTIDGRLLKDSCGETIMLRGVNHGNIWTTNLGILEFAQIAQTNANDGGYPTSKVVAVKADNMNAGIQKEYTGFTGITFGIAIDQTGNLFISDFSKGNIRKYLK